MQGASPNRLNFPFLFAKILFSPELGDSLVFMFTRIANQVFLFLEEFPIVFQPD